MSYQLNAQLEAESFAVSQLSLCEVRLLNQRNLLWLVLIPQRENVTELIELSDTDQRTLLSEMNQVSALLKANFPCDKLNIAMLGNVVSQLHVHVIARCFDDAYFPRAPFGMPADPYPLEAQQALIQRLQDLL